MRKKVFDMIMFWLSILYLVGAAILIMCNKIEWDITNFFNTDGLALLGCLFAAGELFFSKRNPISKLVNQQLLCNRMVNYRVGIVLERIKDAEIEAWLDLFENKLKGLLKMSELNRKVISEVENDSCKMYYEDIGVNIECYKTEGNVNFRITGKTKYGKLHSKKYDLLYLTTLIELLYNKFLQEDFVREHSKLRIVELAVIKQGSQISYGNLFNGELPRSDTFSIGIRENIEEGTQINITDKGIEIKVTEVSSMLNGLVDLTNILCSIE